MSAPVDPKNPNDGLPCPECKGLMRLRDGRRGAFYGCVRFPECKGWLAGPEVDAHLKPMAAEPAVIGAIDTETTGTGSDDVVVEIAAVLADPRTLIPFARWSTLVNPGRPIPPEATAVHGITDDAVAWAPGPAEALEGMLAFLATAKAPLALLAHNAPFDARMIDRAFAAAPGVARPGLPLFCTLRMARTTWPKFRSHALAALVARFGLPPAQAHRAEVDAVACLRVFGCVAEGWDDMTLTDIKPAAIL